MNILKTLFDLHEGEDDKQKTLENIRANLSFTGPNLWILACAIIVASVGLNVNSTAVIIGAMLISPLMGPILGAGFALGTYDFDLLKKSLRNLLIATVASLIVSTIFFYLSPFKEAQSEILARIAPNIYDILIAFFGGLVGVIAITRVEKGNPIPGVAIATALMPPLCTAGYGLGTGNFKFLFGALFLYSINCVFICIATYIIVKFLKYPEKTLDIKYQKQVKYGITALVLLMLLPSAYFAYRLYDKQKFVQSVDRFIEREFTNEGQTVIYKKTNYNSSPRSLEIAFLLKRFTPEEINKINKDMVAYGITNTRITIMQDSTDNIQNLKNNILNEIRGKEAVLDEKDAMIKSLEKEISKNTFDNKQLLKETRALFPAVQSVSLANHTFYDVKDSATVATVMIYDAEKPLGKDDKVKLENWLKQRLNLKVIDIYKQ